MSLIWFIFLLAPLLAISYYQLNLVDENCKIWLDCNLDLHNHSVFELDFNYDLDLDFDVGHDLDMDLNLIHEYNLQPDVDLD